MASLTPLEPGRFSAELDGTSRILTIVPNGGSLWVGEPGCSYELQPRSRTQRLAEHLAGIARVAGVAAPEVRSPMPGTVVIVAVESGDTVQAGQVLLTVEAMKMEHQLAAAIDGVVTISVKPGDVVKLDQIVASIAADPQAGPSEGTVL